MGGNKFEKPNPVVTLQLSYDAEMTVVDTFRIAVNLKLTSQDNISAISWSILKKLEWFRIAIEFRVIWDVAQLSSSICRKVMNKNVNFFPF